MLALRQFFLCRISSFSILAVCFLSGMTAADDYRWIGSSIGDIWGNSHNWENLDNLLEPEIDDGTFPLAGTDTAVIDDTSTGSVVLNGLTQVQYLTIHNNHLETLGHQLNVLRGDASPLPATLTIGGAEGGVGSLLVHDGPDDAFYELIAESARINAGGVLQLFGANAEVGMVSIQPGGILRGSGGFQISPLLVGGASVFFNDGLINSFGGDLLLVTPDEDVVMELDGQFNGGEIAAAAGSLLEVAIPLRNPSFSGTATVLRDSEIRMYSDWTLTADGSINLDGETGTATISGNPLTSLSGTVNVNGGIGVLAANFDAISGVTEVARDASLQVNGTATWRETSALNFNGGTSRFIIGGDVTICTPTFDSSRVDTVFIGGGTLTVKSPIVETSSSEGNVEVVNGSLHIEAPWSSNGMIRLNNASVSGGEIHVSGALIDEDALVLATEGTSNVSAAMRFDEGGQLQVELDAKLDLDGPIDLLAGSKFTADGRINLAGGLHVRREATVEGLGRIVNRQQSTLLFDDETSALLTIDNRGDFVLGETPSRVTVSELVQRDGATLFMEIAGTQPGKDHDQLVVLGDVNLAGTISISLADGFSPTSGSFELFDFGNAIDNGIEFELSGAGGAHRWNTDALLTTGKLEYVGLTCDLNSDDLCNITDLDQLIANVANGQQDLAAVDSWLSNAAMENGLSAAYLKGDLNLDGFVNSEDLNTLGINWQEVGGLWSRGDINGDNLVDSQDLNALGINWQQSVAQSVTAVPETTNFVSILLAAFSIGVRWIRRSCVDNYCRR